jgi:hypothetical protein
MFARKNLVSSIGRTAAMVSVAALALTAVEPSLAQARSARAGKGLTAAAGAGIGGATDISARRRGFPGRGGAGAAAAFAGIVGTGIAIAAAQNRQAYYDDYDGGAPVYYGGPGYYGYRGPSYGPNDYGSSVPYVNGHPLANW